MAIHDQLDPQALPVSGPAPTRDRAPSADVSRSVEDPAKASPDALLELQRLAGNAVVSRMLAPEAQREASADGEEESAGRSPVLDVVGKGGGRPLDVGIRREMEGALGADFSNVRLHTDAAATESARAVNANAYTVGNDVVIRNDRWSPDSSEGKKTIAHELTHVMQQESGPVSGRETGTGIRLSDPSDSFEQAAERTAESVVAGGAGQSQGPSAPAGVQRDAMEEGKDALQGEFVQRAEAEEEELTEDELQGEFVQRAEAPEEEMDEEAGA